MTKSQSAARHSKRGESRSAGRANSFGVLFTCIGRRVSLLNSFREAARQLRLSVSFLGTDKDQLSPALQLCDTRVLVKPVTHSN